MDYQYIFFNKSMIIYNKILKPNFINRLLLYYVLKFLSKTYFLPLTISARLTRIV